MNTQSCNCIPGKSVTKFRAWIQVKDQGGGVYADGLTIDEAIANVIKHARKDSLSKSNWGKCVITSFDGELVGTFSKDGTYGPTV